MIVVDYNQTAISSLMVNLGGRRDVEVNVPLVRHMIINAAYATYIVLLRLARLAGRTSPDPKRDLRTARSAGFAFPCGKRARVCDLRTCEC